MDRECIWFSPHCGFQCSSASRKFLNRDYIARAVAAWRVSVLFSEPKIPQCSRTAISRRSVCGFQCSSASRKFLNYTTITSNERLYVFQCSSASRKFLNTDDARRSCGSKLFQCSSASRKFLNRQVLPRYAPSSDVSVLFSEPKIPQCNLQVRVYPPGQRFSALQRAENSSMRRRSVGSGCC